MKVITNYCHRLIYFEPHSASGHVNTSSCGSNFKQLLKTVKLLCEVISSNYITSVKSLLGE